MSRHTPLLIALLSVGVFTAAACTAHRDVKSRASLGIHWGTFDDLTDEPLYEPPKVLAAEARKPGLAEGEFFVLKHGETRRLARK